MQNRALTVAAADGVVFAAILAGGVATDVLWRRLAVLEPDVPSHCRRFFAGTSFIFCWNLLLFLLHLLLFGFFFL